MYYYLIFCILLGWLSITYVVALLSEIDKEDVIHGPDNLIYAEVLTKDVRFKSYLFSREDISAISLTSGVVIKILV